MNKRSFLLSAAITVASVASISVAPALSRGLDGHESSQPEHVTTFKSIAAIEVTIIDMIHGGNRTVLVESNEPVLVNEGKVPFAISFSEHDGELVEMNVLSRKGKEWIVAQKTFAGKYSTQTLRGHGIVLRIHTHEV